MNIKRTALIGLSVLAAGGGAVATATGSSAAVSHHHCTSHADYRLVHKGQSKKHVAHELGNHGKVMSHASEGGYRDQIRSYSTCGEFDEVVVSFSANPHESYQVDSKSGVWVG